MKRWWGQRLNGVKARLAAPGPPGLCTLSVPLSPDILAVRSSWPISAFLGNQFVFTIRNTLQNHPTKWTRAISGTEHVCIFLFVFLDEIVFHPEIPKVSWMKCAASWGRVPKGLRGLFSMLSQQEKKKTKIVQFLIYRFACFHLAVMRTRRIWSELPIWTFHRHWRF